MSTKNYLSESNSENPKTNTATIESQWVYVKVYRRIFEFFELIFGRKKFFDGGASKCTTCFEGRMVSNPLFFFRDFLEADSKFSKAMPSKEDEKPDGTEEEDTMPCACPYLILFPPQIY